MNNYHEKVARIQNHLRNHPADYQSVISLFKNNSKAIELDRKRKFDKEAGRIAQYMRSVDNGK